MARYKKGKDGRYHGYVSMGTDPLTGKRVRRHVAARKLGDVVRLVKALEEARDRETSAWEVRPCEDWFLHWLAEVEQTRAAATFAKAEWAVHNYLLNAFADLALADLTADLAEDRIRRLSKENPKPQLGTRSKRPRGHAEALGSPRADVTDKTKHEVRRVLKASVAAAVKQGHLKVDPLASMSTTPPQTSSEWEKQILPIESIAAFLRAAAARPNTARWYMALLGLRQSECLGLQWGDINWNEGVVRIQRQWVRRAWRHGCGDAISCAAKAAQCPQRFATSQVRAEGKTRTSGYFGREPVIDDVALIAWMRSRSRGRRWGQQATSAALDLLSTAHTTGMSGSELSRLKRVLRTITPQHLAYLAGGLGGKWGRYRSIELSAGLAFIGPSVEPARLGVIGQNRMSFVQVDSLPGFEAGNMVEADPDGDLGVVERSRDRRHARILLDTYLLGDSRESAAATDALAELGRRL